MLELSKYDGSAGFLVDTNIWIDCMDSGSRWHGWSVDKLHECSGQAPLHVNLVVYTELLIPGPDIEALVTAVAEARGSRPCRTSILAPMPPLPI